MKHTPLLLAFLLSGCGSLGAIDQRIEGAVREGAAVVDNLNAKALWQLCEGSTLGGYQRLSPEVRKRVDDLCLARGGPWERPGG